MDEFYIVRAGTDNSETINEALKKGKNLLITPGRYLLEKSIYIIRPGTIIMGLGMATLIPINGNPVVEIADVDGVTVCGLTIDAGSKFSEVLFRAGEKGTNKSHAPDPVFLYDIFFRVGGPAEGSAKECLEINSNDVCIDHTWLWRADHGNGVGWE